MKRKSIYIILAILVFAGAACGIAAFATNISSQNENLPTVVFDAAKVTDKSEENAVFVENASAYGENQYVDLMPELKNLVPGDKLDSDIKIKVKNIGENKVSSVKLYLTSDYNSDINQASLAAGGSAEKAYNEDYETLLHDFSMMLSVDVDGEKYNGTLDRNASGQIEDSVIFLGEFIEDGEKTIGVDFDFPIEAGNEYSNLIAELGWKFTAEVKYKSEGGGGGGGTTKPKVKGKDLKLNTEDHFAYIQGYPDGTVRPESEITRAEAVTILFRLLTEECRNYYWCADNGYSDVSDSYWFNNAISTLSNAGIANGYPDGSFRPNAKITRAEMAKLVSRFAQLGKTRHSFEDIDGHWAQEYIELSDGNGWIKGYSDNTFRPNRNITRAEVVTILNRVLMRVPSNESKILPETEMQTYSDCKSNRWYYIAVQESTNSHDYKRDNKNDSSDERWTNLKENIDWSKFEK